VTENISYTDHARNLQLKNRNEFKNWAIAWAKAFSDGKITNPRYIDAGDTVIAEFTAEGTNDGPFGSLPPTGRHMSLEFCELFNFDASGRVISGGAYYDQFTLLTQFGHAQTRGAAG
jgi:predicted ester cyclase